MEPIDDQLFDTDDSEISMRRAEDARRISSGVAICLVAALGVYLWLRLPVLVPRTVSGEVRCSSGDPVVGVWVRVIIGDQSGNGFAQLGPPSPDRPATLFTREVKGKSYVVHVGCGGTRQNWKMTAYSPTIEVTTSRLVCFDQLNDTQYQTCAVTSQ